MIGGTHRRQDTSSTAWTGETRSPGEMWLETPPETYTSQISRISLDDQFDSLLASLQSPIISSMFSQRMLLSQYSRYKSLLTHHKADTQDDLQVPASVREKFSLVSSDVKSSFLSSSTNPALFSSLGLPPPSSPSKPKLKNRRSQPFLRKAKSSSSLSSPGNSPKVGKTYAVEGDRFTIVASPLQSPSTPPRPSTHRGMSLDTPRAGTRMSTPARPMSFGMFGSGASPARPRGLGIKVGEREGAEALVSWLRNSRATDVGMDVGRCKKLRMLLRHEATGWVSEFLRMGGYELVLARLQDLFDVEWR